MRKNAIFKPNYTNDSFTSLFNINNNMDRYTQELVHFRGNKCYCTSNYISNKKCPYINIPML